MIQQPLIQPKSNWWPPEAYPRLGDEKILYCDIETKDPNLRTKGPGWVRDDGEIVGYAVGTKTDQWYFPIRHASGGNMDPDITHRFIDDLMKRVPTWAFFHAAYDLGWMTYEGLPMPQNIVCTQSSTALLDENRMRYDLNSVAEDYNCTKKNEAFLREAAKAWGVDPKVELWKLPANCVGEYAEGDIPPVRELWAEHKKELSKQDLMQVWDLEMALIPLNIEMKRRGIRVDLDRADRLNTKWKQEEEDMLNEINRLTGYRPRVTEPKSLGRLFDIAGIWYGRTPKTNQPSITKDFLERQQHPVAKLVARVRRIQRARNNYIRLMFGDYVHNGRLHPTWNPLKAEREDGAKIGTVTGRYSSGDPSLQVIPSVEKSPDLGIELRSLFLPEEGEEWCCEDYAQQEPKWTVHYAYLLNLPGAARAVAAYRDGDIDYHSMMAKMAGIERPPAKIIFLAIVYGKGTKSLCEDLGLEFDEGKALLKKVHSRVPFLRRLAEACSNRAQNRGYVKTALGRRGRFDDWEPVLTFEEKGEFGYVKSVPYETACILRQDQKYPEWYNKAIKRAFGHKALNKIVQGSSADQTKTAMLECYKQGYIPKVQSHDELDFSITNRQQAEDIREIMEQALPISVPMKIDIEIGPSWGEAIAS